MVKLEMVVLAKVEEPVVTRLMVLIRVEFRFVMVEEAEVVVAKVEVALKVAGLLEVKVPET